LIAVIASSQLFVDQPSGWTRRGCEGTAWEGDLAAVKSEKNPYNQNTTKTFNSSQNHKNTESIRLVIAKT